MASRLQGVAHPSSGSVPHLLMEAKLVTTMTATARKPAKQIERAPEAPSAPLTAVPPVPVQELPEGETDAILGDWLVLQFSIACFLLMSFMNLYELVRSVLSYWGW